MKTKFSLLFYMKKQKNYQGGAAPIYVRITVEGQRAEFSTGRACDPCRWNSKVGRARGTREEIKNFNAFLDYLHRQVYEAHRWLYDKGQTITAEAIKSQVTGKGEKPYLLMEIFNDHNQKVKALVGKDFAQSTLNRYVTTFKHVQAFLKHQFGVEDIDIRKIDHSFIAGFDFYLRSVRHCSNNSSVKYVRNVFGKIIRICLSNGWISGNPFRNYKSKIKTVDRVFLSDEEIQKMAAKEFASTWLTEARDVFLFCCFTGLAYVDVKKLRLSQIGIGVDGEQWIFTTRQKTDTRSAIPLLPAAMKLIKKYAHHPLCVNKDIAVPVPSNQKMNKYLKEIATVCEINKTLTSHIARHTFATTVTLSNGVPIESVSKMLGHSSLQQTQHYAKILDIKVSADMRLIRQKY